GSCGTLQFNPGNHLNAYNLLIPMWLFEFAFVRRCLHARSKPQPTQGASNFRETMAKEGQTGSSGLEGLAGVIARASDAPGPKGIEPPVHLWTPPFCGDLDMRIAADGTWFYLKTPIGRPALVKLFASVLKREGDRYFLVTPVEKCGIVV